MVRHLIDNIKLLDRQLIDLIEHIDARDVLAVAFNDIDQLIDCGITPTENIYQKIYISSPTLPIQ